MKPPALPPSFNQRSVSLRLLLCILPLVGASLACAYIIQGNTAYWQKAQSSSTYRYFQAVMFRIPVVASPGKEAFRQISFNGTDEASVVWTPPPGATNFEFDPPPDAGGPPFRWSRAEYLVKVWFDLPPLPEGRSNMVVADTAEVSPVGRPEAVSAVTAYTMIERNPSANRALQAYELRPWAPTAPMTAPITGTVPAW